MTPNVTPQPPIGTIRYLWRCLTGTRMEWSYRLRLFWSGLKYEVLGR